MEGGLHSASWGRSSQEKHPLPGMRRMLLPEAALSHEETASGWSVWLDKPDFWIKGTPSRDCMQIPWGLVPG
jgi:hypothetical protein